MSIYHMTSMPNALANLDGQDAKTIFDDRIRFYLSTAWAIVGERKDFLELYPYLLAYTDNKKEIVKISPIPPWVELDFEFTEIENIALAIMENCFYLRGNAYESKLPIDNLLSISAACGELYSELYLLKEKENINEEFFAAGYYTELDKSSEKIITTEADTTEADKWQKDREKTNLLIMEIDEIIGKFLAEGKKVRAQYVWKELVARCVSDNNSCCKKLWTGKDNKPVIEWYGIQNNESFLSYKALQGILDRTRKKKPR